MMQMEPQSRRKQVYRVVGPVWTQFGGSLRSHKGGAGGGGGGRCLQAETATASLHSAAGTLASCQAN